ncbi:hypothetical protein Zmor_003877 [Zophobas morio]|jgi:hypothetical protein|uniref:Uncharacterized protein n=1 Tax=Zophobas morio TaxID=2755281 RepID=A0AA38HJ83_9CUCU|nr:hypothetical protein Zmor_003877 [Zophobas morio]
MVPSNENLIKAYNLIDEVIFYEIFSDAPTRELVMNLSVDEPVEVEDVIKNGVEDQKDIIEQMTAKGALEGIRRTIRYIKTVDAKDSVL